ncbi:MAG: energy transducer TonB [Alphaproteobacteria bacterium]
MTTYAPVPIFAQRRRHPRALAIIIAVHAGAIAAVMSAKMDLPVRLDPTVTRVELLPEPATPSPEPLPPSPRPGRQTVERVPAVVPMPQPILPALEPSLPDPGPAIGVDPRPSLDPPPRADPVRTGPRFATPEALLKPPYPQQKLRLEEEAALRLKLTIDSRGRVTAVDPIGRSDPIFLAAARRHLIAHWRYKPATEDGRPVPSSTVVTVTFRLED